MFPYHDQLGRANFTTVGGSITWTYSDHSHFSFSYLTDIAGRNGHKVDDSWAVNYDYEFGRH